METVLTRRRNVALLAILCCCLWGSATPFIKMGYGLFGIDTSDTASLILFAGIRFTLAGVLVVLMGSVPRKKFLRPKKTSWGMVLRLCLFQTVMQYVCYYIGLAHASSVKTSILNSAGTFFCILVASLVFHQETLRPYKVAGCLVGFAGVVLVNLTPQGFGGSVSFWRPLPMPFPPRSSRAIPSGRVPWSSAATSLCWAGPLWPRRACSAAGSSIPRP